MTAPHLLIALHEAATRLRRPSFWLLTLLLPLLLAALYALPVAASLQHPEVQRVVVADETGLFASALASDELLHFHNVPSLAEASASTTDADLLLYIPLNQTAIPRDAFLYYHGTAPTPAAVGAIDARLQALLQTAILEDVYHVPPAVRRSVGNAHLRLHTADAATGHEAHLGMRHSVAMVLSIAIALVILLFGMQTMRSVQAERQNRVAELLLTSVRPVQLLGGKLGGIALTALLQLILWIGLTAAAIATVQAAAPGLFEAARAAEQAPILATRGAEATAQYTTAAPSAVVDAAVQGLSAINLPLTAALFALFFLLGTAFYGLLLAALAARLDADADALQWTLVVGSPLLLSAAAVAAGWHPSTLFLLLPFTAPTAAMAALPFGLSSAHVVLAAAILILSTAAAAFLAAKQYHRTLTT